MRNTPMQHARERIDVGFAVLGCLSFAVCDMMFHMLPPFLPRLLLTRGLSEVEVGVVMAASSATMILAVFVLRCLLRCFSRYGLMLIGLAANAAGSLLFPLLRYLPDGAPVLVAALAIMLLKGFAGGTFEVVMRALLLETSPPGQVARVVGWLAVSRNAGGLIGPVLGGWLFEVGGAKLPFLVGGGCAMPLVAALWCKQSSVEANSRGSTNSGSGVSRSDVSSSGDGQSGDGGSGSNGCGVAGRAERSHEPTTAPAAPATAAAMLRMRSVQLAVGLIFCPVVSTDMLGLVLPLFLSQPAASGGPFALPASRIGLIFAARGLVGMLAAIGHARVNRALGDECEALLGALLMGAALLFIGPFPPMHGLIPAGSHLAATVTAVCVFAVAFELTLLPNNSMMLGAVRRGGLDVRGAAQLISTFDQATGTTAAVTGRLIAGSLIRPLGYPNTVSAFAAVPALLAPLLALQAVSSCCARRRALLVKRRAAARAFAVTEATGAAPLLEGLG